MSEAWGFSLLDLRLWPAESIAPYERGPAVELPRLVRVAGDPDIHLLDGGFRRHVPNPKALRGFHLADEPVEVLSRAELEVFPEGRSLTQLPYIVVSPAPEHRAYLVDYPRPVPPPPMVTADAGPRDARGPTLDAEMAADAAPPDATGTRPRGDAPDSGLVPRSPGDVWGGCSVSKHAPDHAAGLSLLLFTALLVTRRKCRITFSTRGAGAVHRS